MTEEKYIKLDSFMKWRQMADSGGQAKIAIQNGEVKVNGKTETRRGRKLVIGDKVTYNGKSVVVELYSFQEKVYWFLCCCLCAQGLTIPAHHALNGAGQTGKVAQLTVHFFN